VLRLRKGRGGVNRELFNGEFTKTLCGLIFSKFEGRSIMTVAITPRMRLAIIKMAMDMNVPQRS